MKIMAPEAAVSNAKKAREIILCNLNYDLENLPGNWLWLIEFLNWPHVHQFSKLNCGNRNVGNY